jgi:hypothetical protein
MITPLQRTILPLSALGFCALTDPHQNEGLILCPFRLVTGLPCPLCGMTRGVGSLLRARWADAAAYHPFSPVVLAGLLAWLAIDLGRAAGLWRLGGVDETLKQPAPWLCLAATFSTYGLWRWWSILRS